jgi:hypothetical protein
MMIFQNLKILRKPKAQLEKVGKEQERTTTERLKNLRGRMSLGEVGKFWITLSLKEQQMN